MKLYTKDWRLLRLFKYRHLYVWDEKVAECPRHMGYVQHGKWHSRISKLYAMGLVRGIPDYSDAEDAAYITELWLTDAGLKLVEEA